MLVQRDLCQEVSQCPRVYCTLGGFCLLCLVPDIDQEDEYLPVGGEKYTRIADREACASKSESR